MMRGCTWGDFLILWLGTFVILTHDFRMVLLVESTRELLRILVLILRITGGNFRETGRLVLLDHSNSK